ncbi:MAG: hypothetical protein HC821_03010, partial [Lewinella sp.]|nr:hypothetical protein [Lewinella sp.]
MNAVAKTRRLTPLSAPLPLAAEVVVRNLRCQEPPNAGALAYTNVSGGVPPYLYAINEGAFGQDSIFTGLVEDRYTLRLEDALGCTLARRAVVNAPPILWADLGQDQQVLLGDSIRLVLVSNSTDLSYAWSFDSSLQTPQVWLQPRGTM